MRMQREYLGPAVKARDLGGLRESREFWIERVRRRKATDFSLFAQSSNNNPFGFTFESFTRAAYVFLAYSLRGLRSRGYGFVENPLLSRNYRCNLGCASARGEWARRINSVNKTLVFFSRSSFSLPSLKRKLRPVSNSSASRRKNSNQLQKVQR